MIRKVLIVDDDREMLHSLQEGLEKYYESFSIAIAEDGSIAFDILKTNTISLVVTDLKMPHVDGFTLLAHVMEHYPDIPVIIITGYSTPEMENLAREGGAVGYIAKPFMIENLAKQIITTLRKETEGGTLHNVSSGIFLQLMEIEQKTCTIRLIEKETAKKGVLFFKEGELYDARYSNLQGKRAAYEIFAWESVNLSIQNGCPDIENCIQSELQPIILEAMRRKDEGASDFDTAEGEPEEPEEVEVLEDIEIIEEDFSDPVSAIQNKLDEKIGARCGLEDVFKDSAWDGMISQFSRLGVFFSAGKLKLGYVDRGENNDFVLVPSEETVIIAVNPKCPRDQIIKVLIDEE